MIQSREHVSISDHVKSNLSCSSFEDFSCRSSTIPRLLYGVKKLLSDKDLSSWRIHLIRNRQFGRKLVQSVLTSDAISSRNQTDVDLVDSDLFLMSGDYLIIECDNVIQTHCYFLVYFMYKAQSVDYEEPCDNNEFPQLFKFVSLPVNSTTFVVRSD